MSVKAFKSEFLSDKLGQPMFRVQVVNEDDTVIEKTITSEDYLTILGSSLFTKDQEKYSRIGKLPDKYYDGEVSCQKNTFKVVLYYPGEVRPVCFLNKHWRVPFPSLVFYFSVKDGTVIKKGVFATRGESIDDDTELFMYPFGNVNASGGICFGNIDVGPIRCMEDIASYVEAFFNSETNNDYYNGHKLEWSQAELLERLKKKKVYPESWLVPTESNCKVVGQLLGKEF